MSPDIYFHLIAIIYLSLLLYFVFLKASKKINVSFYIIGLYLLSVIGGLFLDSTLAAPSSTYSLWATFLFLGLLSLFFVPLILSRTEKIQKVVCPNYKMFDAVCYVFIFIGIASYLYFPPIIYKIIVSLGDFESFRGLDTGMGGDPVYLFLTLGCQFFPIVLLFYFHSVCYRPERVWFNRLLLLSSTAYIINVLTVMGRDGFILWTMSYIFTFILYKNILPISMKEKVKKSLAIFLSLFSVIFFLISITRFYVDGSVYFLFQKLLVYFSQQFGEFNRFVTVVKTPNIDVGKVFPLVDFFVTPGERKNFITMHYQFLSQYGFSQNVFKTFFGEFYQNLGLLITFFVSCLFAFLFSIPSLVGSTSSVNLGKLILLTIFSQVILHGFFYFKLSYMVSNIYILICLILSFIFTHKMAVSNVYRDF